MECIFCKIVEKELRAEMVAENDIAVAFRDIHPQAPVHILVVSRKHCVSLRDVSDDDRDLLGGVLLFVRDLIEKIDLGENYKVVVNGRDVGHVGHLHFHLLGGWKEKPAQVNV